MSIRSKHVAATSHAKRFVLIGVSVAGLITFVGVSTSSGQAFPYAPTTLKLIDPPVPGPVVTLAPVVTPAPIVADPGLKSVVTLAPAPLVAKAGAEVAGIQVVPAADPGLAPKKPVAQVAGVQIETSPVALTGSNAWPGVVVGLGLAGAGAALLAASRRRKSA